MVSEIWKTRAHRGLPPALSFYRDRRALEVDAVLEMGSRVVAVEAKSARTVVPDFFAPLDALAAIVGSGRRARPLRRIVIYGGSRLETRGGATVVPWSPVGTEELRDSLRPPSHPRRPAAPPP